MTDKPLINKSTLVVQLDRTLTHEQFRATQIELEELFPWYRVVCIQCNGLTVLSPPPSFMPPPVPPPPEPEPREAPTERRTFKPKRNR